jgi:hypothetical protein
MCRTFYLFGGWAEDLISLFIRDVCDVCENTSIGCTPAAKFNLKQIYADCLVVCAENFLLEIGDLIKCCKFHAFKTHTHTKSRAGV